LYLVSGQKYIKIKNDFIAIFSLFFNPPAGVAGCLILKYHLIKRNQKSHQQKFIL